MMQAVGTRDVKPAIFVGETRATMGARAAADVAGELISRLGRQSEVRIVLAAAPSQQELLDELVEARNIDWSRVIAFHMDEYVGLSADASQRFGLWLRRSFFDRVPLKEINILDPDTDPMRAANDYALRLAQAPIDIVCLGVGVNGHLAFNDPPADLEDPAAVRLVELDEICRRQQVDDGCFDRLEEVPTRALTLTVPRLLAAERLFCVVPGAQKRRAVERLLREPIGSDCPATALRLHPACRLYLDTASCPMNLRPNPGIGPI